MFGSLALVLPTPHSGGSLILRHHGEEWTFSSGKAAAGGADPIVAFIAFDSDEVSLVESGHRITLTYNLYYDDTETKHKPSPSGAVSLTATHETLFRTALRNALCDASFLPESGLPGFTLRREYPVEDSLTIDESSLEQLPRCSKGSDAVVWRICEEFSLPESACFSCVDDNRDETRRIHMAYPPILRFARRSSIGAGLLAI